MWSIFNRNRRDHRQRSRRRRRAHLFDHLQIWTLNCFSGEPISRYKALNWMHFIISKSSQPNTTVFVAELPYHQIPQLKQWTRESFSNFTFCASFKIFIFYFQWSCHFSSFNDRAIRWCAESGSQATNNCFSLSPKCVILLVGHHLSHRVYILLNTAGGGE